MLWKHTERHTAIWRRPSGTIFPQLSIIIWRLGWKKTAQPERLTVIPISQRRVEYYDENNNLREFSEVNNFDSSTNSYTEEVYENLGESYVHDRTDTYVNGVLVSSEKH